MTKTHDLINRQDPHDLDAERGVLGSIILKLDVLDEVSCLLNPESFYDDAHAVLYRHLKAIHDAGKRFDDVIMTDRLKAAGEYNAVGGAAYLSKVVNAVPNAAHAIYYAEIVSELSKLRTAIVGATEMLEAAYDRLPSDDLTAIAERTLTALSRGSLRRAVPLQEVFGRVLADLQARVGKAEPLAMLSGLPDADRIGFCFAPGELILLAGRPSSGKTALAAQICLHHANKGRAVMFATLEMDPDAVGTRMLCAKSGVNHQVIKTRGVDQVDVDDMQRAAERIGDVPLFLYHEPDVRVAWISALAAKHKARHDLRLLCVDYTSWIVHENKRLDNRLQVGETLKGLRRIAQRLKIPVLLLHQLNRQSDDEEPKLSHLAESGCAEQDADVVAFLRRIETKAGAQPVVELTTMKNRQGTTGKAALYWHPATTTFTSPE